MPGLNFWLFKFVYSDYQISSQHCLHAVFSSSHECVLHIFAFTFIFLFHFCSFTFYPASCDLATRIVYPDSRSNLRFVSSLLVRPWLQTTKRRRSHKYRATSPGRFAPTDRIVHSDWLAKHPLSLCVILVCVPRKNYYYFFLHKTACENVGFRFGFDTTPLPEWISIIDFSFLFLFSHLNFLFAVSTVEMKQQLTLLCAALWTCAGWRHGPANEWGSHFLYSSFLFSPDSVLHSLL